jgi:hypothetical protein
MKNKLYFPFRVSYLGKEESKHNFLVNAGDINSFIFNTYKANFYQTSFNKDVFNAVNSLNLETFEYTKKWQSTFSSNESCDVYLTIPKIPAAFEDNSIPICFNKQRKEPEKTPITVDDNKYKGPDWWQGIFPNDFINQFKIVTSSDESFQSDYNNNILYVEQNNNYKNLKGIVLAKDSEFPGKIYIKLATIIINNNNISIKRYFQSNVISPTKYLRLGAMPIRNIRILYSTMSKIIGEAWIIRSSTGFVVKTGLSGSSSLSGGGEYNNPLLFFKTIPEIKESVISEIESTIKAVNKKYFYGAFYSGDRRIVSAIHNQKYKLQDLILYQVVLIYKDNLNGKWIIERIYNNKQGAQGIIDIVAAAGEALAAGVNEGGGLENGTELVGSFSTDRSLKDILSKDNIIQDIGLRQQITDPQLINLNVNDLLEFIGFEDEPVEGN